MRRNSQASQLKLLVRGAACVLAFASAAAGAAPYDMSVLRIDVPDGFAGPVTQHPDATSTVTGFVKNYPKDTRGTLLQITTYDVGTSLKSMSESARISTTDTYLDQMLAGVARKRMAFKASPPAHIRIGGMAASRESWTGSAQGQGMAGTMYCVIVGGVVVFFHTQDFVDAPAGNREQALRAIETVAFRRK